LLVLDIDGNDYHVWQVLKFNPMVVMIEYNYNLDPNLNIVIKYNKELKTKIKDKYTNASVKAPYLLGRTKGYTLLEINIANMFFIKD
tara:strand:+ start:104 stop:364 length:261 start_codon:yes stop_codon:yes gene_type:complete